MVLELPFPPSLNTYWRRGKGRVYINERGLEYRKHVATYVRQHELKAPEGFLTYAVWLYPPDKRRRDGDNFAQQQPFLRSLPVYLQLLRR